MSAFFDFVEYFLFHGQAFFFLRRFMVRVLLVLVYFQVHLLDNTVGDRKVGYFSGAVMICSSSKSRFLGHRVVDLMFKYFMNLAHMWS